MTQNIDLIVVVVLLIAGAAGVAVGLVNWVDSRTTRAVRAASSQVGLQRVDTTLLTHPRRGEFPPAEVYAGVVDGMGVRVGPYWSLIAAGTKVAALSGVGVVAALPRPLPFRLKISRGGWPPPSMRLGDRRFDRSCRITTDDPAAVTELLASAALRDEIRGLLLGSARLGQIDEAELSLRLFDVHWKGTVSVLAAINNVVRVARAIDDARRLEHVDRARHGDRNCGHHDNELLR